MFINNKAQLKPRSEQPSRNTGSPTRRYCNLANELGARAPEQWAVMRGPWTHAPVHRYMVQVSWTLLRGSTTTKRASVS